MATQIIDGNGHATGDGRFWAELDQSYKRHRAGESSVSIARRYGVPATLADSALHMYRMGEKVGGSVKLGEVLVADPRASIGIDAEVYNPDVVAGRRGGLDVYDEMHRDDQVKAALALKKRAVAASGWAVTSPPDQAEDWEVTEFVRHQFETMPGTMGNAIRQVCSAFGYGFSLTEIVLREITEGRHAGKVGLGGLKTRKPHSITFRQDRHGNVLEVLQEGDVAARGTKQSIPPWKALHFAYDSDFSNPYGTSDLQSAFRAWWNKRQAYRGFAVLLERYGVPPTYAMVNETIFGQGAQGNIATVLARLQMGSSGVFPRGKEESNITFWTPELANGISTAYVPALDMMNKDISRAILMPGLLGLTAEDKAGSHARAGVNFDVFQVVIEAVQRDLADLINERVVRLLVDLNFGNVGDEYPLFAFNPMADETRCDLLEEYLDMVEGGVLGVGDEDEAHIRTQLKFPARGDEEGRPPREVTPKPPPSEDDDGDDEGDELFDLDDRRLVADEVKTHATREATRYEREVDFGALNAELDEIEVEKRDEIQAALTEVRDALINRAGDLSPEALKKLPKWAKVEKSVDALLAAAFVAGRRSTKGEISRARKNGRRSS